MPSEMHEWLLELFRNRCATATDLLRELDVKLPGYDEIRIESPNVNSLKPVEYRADLVLFLARKSQSVLGIIVEVQTRRDARKSYSWPVYVANLRARHRCPVCLLVVTAADSVARWARKTIKLGPGNYCTPWVMGPSDMPVVTDMQEARENPELAVLSAIGHGREPDAEMARRIVATALAAANGIDYERANLYWEIINSQLTSTPKGLEDAVGSELTKYRSEFQRRHVTRGIAKGKTEGRVEIILELLATRFGSLSESTRTRVRGATAKQVHTIAKRVLTAQTLEEALGSL